MLILRFVVCMLLVCMMVFDVGVVSGQNYPTKTIRLVTTEMGSTGDLTARQIAPGLASSVGQQVIVENRTAMMPMLLVAKAPPDGYTLIVSGSGFWIMPLILSDVNYDPVKDFLPITMATRSPGILVVHPSVPVKSVKELIALAKARPGDLNYASGSTGTSTHLGMELFNDMAGVKIIRVPYKGSLPALNAMLAGETEVMMPTAGAVMAFIRSGRVRALAIGTKEPSPLAPELPTVSDSGLPGYENTAQIGVWAPAKTPALIIKRLNQEIVRVLNGAGVKERLLNIGVEIAGSSPEQFAATIKSEMTRYGKLIK